jgi:sarcosine oxidase
MRTDFDYIVLGCGGIGSGALYWLSRRAGRDVLGLEQFKLFHPNGGSHDHSRIIRLYYHKETYTRLTPHTYQAWATLEEESGVRVVTKTGGLAIKPIGSRNRSATEDAMQAMDVAGIPYERLNADEVMKRWPQFRFPTDVDALFQADTGIADPHKANGAHIAMARAYGATILENCPVRALDPFGGGVAVQTDRGRFTCRRLVITAGSWTDRVLASVGMNLGLIVTQEQVTYFATPNLKEFAVGRFPVFMWDDWAYIYGFPVYGEVATKIAMDAQGPVVTPETRSFEPDPEQERQLEEWLATHIPGFLGPKLYSKTCLYDMPRDRGFILDTLPEHPQIQVCVGAGHGFKFASLLGKIMSQVAIDGRTQHPIGDFRVTRPAVTDPTYPLSLGGRWLPDSGA